MSAEKSSGAMSRPAISLSIAWFFSDAREGAENTLPFVLQMRVSSSNAKSTVLVNREAFCT
jgi:hypothetical protein